MSGARFRDGPASRDGRACACAKEFPVSVDYDVVRGAIARIHLTRPEPRNSIGPDDARQILRYLRRAIADESVRVFVFSGEGAHFSSGADVVEYGEIASEARAGKRPISDLMAVLNVTLETNRLLRTPNILSIAAVKGWIVGQALELCIASDFIVASEDAKF